MADTLTTSYGFTPNATTFELAIPAFAGDGFATKNYSSNSGRAEVTLTNLSAPYTEEELITLRQQENGSGLATSLKPYNPSPVKYPVSVWGSKFEAIATTTSSTKPEFRIDSATVCNITFRNDMSPYITNDLMLIALKEALSPLFDKDGNFIGAKLMRGAVLPDCCSTTANAD